MRQLKDRAENQPRRVVHYKESNQNLPPNDVKNKDGQYQPNRKIDDFGEDQPHPLCGVALAVGVGELSFLITRQLNKVSHYGPLKGQQTVKQYKV